MSTEVDTTIKIEKIQHSKISEVDFNNIPFGQVLTDHMFVCDFTDGKWQQPKIVPYQNLSLDPSSKIFHYGQSVFEGMKAYKGEGGKIWLFRPEDNQKRINISAKRMAIPEFPEEYFMEGLKSLIKLDNDWIPTTEGSSLYIRPFIFASGAGLHASTSDEYKFVIACSPSGTYFDRKIKVLIELNYSRSANGGVGFAKAGGNYGGQFYPTKLANDRGYDQVIWTDDTSHQYIEEAGAMNIFVRIKNTLITAPISDRILDGITRKSIIEIAKDEGINMEVRKISVNEIINASDNGSLKEMFGVGTAAVITPISVFGFKERDYNLPDLNNPYADLLKKRITDIQYNRSEDKYGWRYEVK